MHCGEDVKQLRHLGELDAALPLDAGDAHANVLVFSTDDGSDEGDTDDEEEGADDESDEAMSQDSNGQDDDNEEVDAAGGSEDDDMEGSSDDDSDDVSEKVYDVWYHCVSTIVTAHAQRSDT
jgi:hypothetical protein